MTAPEKATGVELTPQAAEKARALLSQEGRDDLALRCLLYTSPSPRDKRQSRMPSSA